MACFKLSGQARDFAAHAEILAFLNARRGSFSDSIDSLFFPA